VETKTHRDDRRDFAARMVGILNGGALALMLSIGHRAGLFDVMAGRHGFATSQEIADEAGLVERYVREWLGSMVTGRIVEYCPERSAYRLPPARAAVLTRGSRPHNMAAAAQWVSLLGAVEDRVLACFERGGGIPLSAYERFHQVMSELSSELVVPALRDAILPLVPGSVAALERGIDVLDIGCGNGRVANEMAAAYPASRFTGYDLSVEAITMARAEARERGLENAVFEVRDAADLSAQESYDLITAFETLHDMARPANVLAGVVAALRPHGFFLMQDIAGSSHLESDLGFPLAPMLYAVSCLHSTCVSLAGDGAALGAMWGREQARRMLEEAGLVKLAVHSLPHDPINLYFVAQRSG